MEELDYQYPLGWTWQPLALLGLKELFCLHRGTIAVSV